MLDRIEPAIVDMAPQVALVANELLPITTLPDAAFAAVLTDGTELIDFRDRFREADLDPAPSDREIRVTLRQCPNSMDMIWQYHHRVDLEGKPVPGLADSTAKIFDIVDQQTTVAVKKIDREEIGLLAEVSGLRGQSAA